MADPNLPKGYTISYDLHVQQ